MDLNKIKDTVRTYSFQFLGERVTVSYRMGALGASIADMPTGNEEQDRGLMGRFIERVILDWDLTDGDEKIPPTAEMVEKYDLPTPFLGAVLHYMREDHDPKQLRSKTT